MTSQQKFFRFSFVSAVIGLFVVIILWPTTKPQSAVEEYFNGRSELRLRLLKPIHDSLETAWSPFFPKELWKAIHFLDSTNCSVPNHDTALLCIRNLYYCSDASVYASAHMLIFDHPTHDSQINDNNVFHFNPLKHGYILKCSGVLIGITFDDERTVWIRRLKLSVHK